MRRAFVAGDSYRTPEEKGDRVELDHYGAVPRLPEGWLKVYSSGYTGDYY